MLGVVGEARLSSDEAGGGVSDRRVETAELRSAGRATSESSRATNSSTRGAVKSTNVGVEDGSDPELVDMDGQRSTRVGVGDLGS